MNLKDIKRELGQDQSFDIRNVVGMEDLNHWHARRHGAMVNAEEMTNTNSSTPLSRSKNACKSANESLPICCSSIS
ncbi:hypothetical protein T10_866 [Trichinella papuae]|uniref:Uncharacterized protein n=1 Tax=Trichinella papuae TaxID=268474 RepID=A0A0V1N0T6_9BILA|nr:hypothetical protein T10_866 [Trichinella papuae]